MRFISKLLEYTSMIQIFAVSFRFSFMHCRWMSQTPNFFLSKKNDIFKTNSFLVIVFFLSRNAEPRARPDEGQHLTMSSPRSSVILHSPTKSGSRRKNSKYLQNEFSATPCSFLFFVFFGLRLFSPLLSLVFWLWSFAKRQMFHRS